ncbi:MAG: polymerase [Pedosphaera sp.]|nr:polymerase [Pedosphaera sp.]
MGKILQEQTEGTEGFRRVASTSGMPGGRKALVLRYSDFTTLTRQTSVEEPLTEAADIYRLACFLLGRDKLVSRALRLLGLGVGNLREPNGQQLALL